MSPSLLCWIRYLAASATEAAGAASVEWEGRAVPVPSGAASAALRGARFALLEASESARAPSSPAALLRALAAAAALLAALDAARDAATGSDTTWTRALLGWTRTEQEKVGAKKETSSFLLSQSCSSFLVCHQAVIHRNDLLVRLIALHAGLSGLGPMPADEPACAKGASISQEEKDSFFAASQELREEKKGRVLFLKFLWQVCWKGSCVVFECGARAGRPGEPGAAS